MKEIINTILRYNDDESWYCYGVEELADMLKAKSEIGWENRTDEIIKQNSIIIIRILEAATVLNDDLIIDIVSELVYICSDEIIRHIFSMIGDKWAYRLSREVLLVILSRMKSIKPDLPSNEFDQIIVERINRYLAKK